MAVRQRVERGHVTGGHFFTPGTLAEYLLDHKGIHVDHRRLQQMQRKDGHLVVVSPVGDQFIAIAIKDEVIHTVPALDDIEPGINLAAQLRIAEIPVQKDCFDSLAQFQKGRVSSVI